MVPGKYSLAAVGRYLVESFDRRRPGLREWPKELTASLQAEADREIDQMERQCSELGVADAKYWQRVRGAVRDVVIPRYRALAEDEIALANRDYGIWRGGDLVARGVFAVAGFLLGVIAVETPYIPIYAKWFPAVLLVLGPVFPDLALSWFHARYRRKLEALVADLERANESLDRYRPLSEVQEALLAPEASPPLRADLAEGPASAAPQTPTDPAKVRS